MLHLRAHSVYSYQRSICYIKDIARIAKEQGEKSFAVSDLDSLTSFIKAEAVANSRGDKMHLIHGLDANVQAPDALSERWVNDRMKWLSKEMNLKRTTEGMAERYREELEGLESTETVPHFQLLLIAKDETGLRNIMKLYTEQQYDDVSYHMTEEKITQNGEGILVLTGSHDGYDRYMLEHGHPEEAMAHLQQMKERFGSALFGQMEWDTPDELIRIYDTVGIPLVAVNDCRYPTVDQRLDYRLFVNIMSKKAPLSFRENMELMDEDRFHSLLQTDLLRSRYTEAMRNLRTIEGQCEGCNVPRATEWKDRYEELREMAVEGWHRLREGGERAEESWKRMEYELGVIKDSGFTEYFIKVRKIIQIAYELNVMCGPARGSGGGSEVCYLTGITKMDPLKYGLFFERFLNPGRAMTGHPPDIDLDFASLPGRVRVE